MWRKQVTILIVGVWALTSSSGCQGSSAPSLVWNPYPSSDKFILRCRAESDMTQFGDHPIEWTFVVAPVEAKGLGDGNGVLLFVSSCKTTFGNDYTPGGKKTMYLSADRPPADHPVQLKDSDLTPVHASFQMRIDSSRRAVLLDPNGLPIDLGGKQEETPPYVTDYLHRSGFWYVFPALAESFAFLPPTDVRVGSTWPVNGAGVFPGNIQNYGLLTKGAGPAREECTCRCDRIDQTPKGRIATISISGTRWPGYPPGRPKRVPSLTVKGELSVNVDTGRIHRLVVESVANFSDPEVGKESRYSFVDRISTEDIGTQQN